MGIIAVCGSLRQPGHVTYFSHNFIGNRVKGTLEGDLVLIDIDRQIVQSLCHIRSKKVTPLLDDSPIAKY